MPLQAIPRPKSQQPQYQAFGILPRPGAPPQPPPTGKLPIPPPGMVQAGGPGGMPPIQRGGVGGALPNAPAYPGIPQIGGPGGMPPRALAGPAAPISPAGAPSNLPPNLEQAVLPQVPPSPQPEPPGPMFGAPSSVGQGDLGYSSYNIWGPEQQQQMQQNLGKMFGGASQTLAGLGGSSGLQGVMGTALKGLLARSGAGVGREGAMAQGNENLKIQAAQQQRGNALANLLTQMGTTGDPETDMALQGSLSGLFGAGLGGAGGLPGGGTGGGPGAPPIGIGGPGGGGAPPGLPPPGMNVPFGGGGAAAPGGIPGMGGGGGEANDRANAMALAQGQNAGISALMRPSGMGGISSASGGVQQGNANDFGSALAGAMNRVNQNNLGWRQYQAGQQFGQQDLRANALQNYLQYLTGTIPSSLQATYGV